jgi:hypothetical protein
MLSLMASEKNSLQNLKKNPDFYNSVSDIFNSKLSLGTKVQGAQ